MKLNPLIFREYDIRGREGEDLTFETVRLLGEAIGTYYRERGIRDITLSRDCRLSSPSFREALLEGLLETGLEVTDLGMTPTPLLYFSIVRLKREGGVMITASHNPPEFNGFKICVGKDAIWGPEIQKIREIAETGKFARGEGRLSFYDIFPDYKTFILKDIKLKSKLKVAIDPGNGTVGPFIRPLLEELGCEVYSLNLEPDGRFPNHHPDPIVEENLRDLINTVREKGAHVGFGYDGDGDRLGVVDEKGRIVWGDRLLIIFARSILPQMKGAKVIAEVKCSQVLFDEIEKLGGIPIMYKTGHSLIKEKMRREGAVLAGEMSGHMFFADRYFGFDDALYASLRLLEIMAETGKSLSQLLEGIPETYVTPEIRIPCPDEVKFQLVEAFKEKIRGKYEFVDIDGVRLKFPDGWGLIRASNTQPALVLRFEAQTEERLKEIRSLVENLLEETKRELG